MIPKIIHTYNFIDLSDVSYDMSLWLDKLKSKFPDYEVKLWDYDSVTEYLKDNPRTYVKECKENGGIGKYYLSYYFRFLAVSQLGGFFIEPFTHVDDIHDLYSLENNDLVLEFNDIENLNADFFGCSVGLNHKCMKSLLNTLGEIKLINKNYTRNLFNPNKLFMKHCKSIIEEYKLVSQGYTCKDSIYVIYNPKIFPNQWEPDKSYIPKVSIVLPIYNAQEYLSECLESIENQTFTDYELICVDDGSTDSSADIILSRNDDKIIYIKKEHSGLVDTLNIGMRLSLGKYIMRHDSDDIMLSHRLEYQVNLMESKNIDILSNGFRWWTPGVNDNKYYRNHLGYIGISQQLHGNKMAHPCTCFKRSSINKLPFLYEEYYKCAEDYKLWFTALSHGLKIYIDGEVVNWYRLHKEQVTSSKQDDMWRSTRIASKAYNPCNVNNDKNKLTCIIPFQNEGMEIEKTVASIRGTSNVNILLVDDYSTDNYDYKAVANIFGCKYIRTEKNLGVAGCRDFAIEQCSTEYFLLLDGHMRFYDEGWESRLIEELDKNQKAIVTGNTLVFSHDYRVDKYKDENHFGYGSIPHRASNINDWEDGWIFTAKWTKQEFPGYKDNSVVPVSCCMGAVYACNKTWWKHIGGLRGLEKWGQDEPYMSIKTWLAGGEVLLIKDWGVGHLYRNESAYLVPSKQRLKNRVFLIHFFIKDYKKLECELLKYKKLVGDKAYRESIVEFGRDSKELLALKKDFWDNIAIHELDWYLTEINDKVKTNSQLRGL